MVGEKDEPLPVVLTDLSADPKLPGRRGGGREPADRTLGNLDSPRGGQGHPRARGPAQI